MTAIEEVNDTSTALKLYASSFYGARYSLCRLHHLCTYLQHTHSVGVPEDLVCFCIVAVADVCGSNEELKRIVLFQIKSSTFYLLLQLFHTFLAMAEADTR